MIRMGSGLHADALDHGIGDGLEGGVRVAEDGLHIDFAAVKKT
jgi:hypothetical protein